ncbi:MAG: 4Fe-4S binding protein [Candidatus Aadella gelida]|nr:4Fe-4S binding protein [Candidatus Aadella gelida]
MAKRKIIKIDDEKCNGCGQCIPNCPEGALQMIDGKARLISDLCCDGLGACIGKCPEGAITTEEREAEAYNEKEVMKNIVKQGVNVLKAHLEHLKEHGEDEYYKEAISFLREKGIELPGGSEESDKKSKVHSGCPGIKAMDFSAKKKDKESEETGQRVSELTQWPVQLHLVQPNAAYFQGKDVVLAADCVAYALADFHKDHLKGKSLAIACPKLDSDQDIYVNKIKELINTAKINTLTVMTMEVPCCSGLLAIAKKSAEDAERKIPVKHVVVGIQGDILKEEWL